MSGLLDEVLTAHGGLERWRAVTALTAQGRFGGLLRSRFPENMPVGGGHASADPETLPAQTSRLDPSCDSIGRIAAVGETE